MLLSVLLTSRFVGVCRQLATEFAFIRFLLRKAIHRRHFVFAWW